LLSPAKAKEKALKALFARKLIEKGWLTALLSLYVLKRREARAGLKHVGDVALQRKDFGALARLTYYTARCWPGLPEELARTAGSLLKPQDALPWLRSTVFLAYLCDKSRGLGKRASASVSPERISLEIDGAHVAFKPLCISTTLDGIFIRGEYDVPEVLSGLSGRDVVDVGANVGDTAIHFILHGARKVIAVEPLPNVAKCAVENVKLNNMADRVKVVNAALSNEPVSVPCDQPVYSSGSFSALGTSGPCRVPDVTLGDLLNMVEDPYLLKMDCEGCEAQVILGPEREKLRAFENIIFEAHPYTSGVSNDKLLASLKELWFECRLHITLEPKLGQNIYHCENSKPRQPNGMF